MTRVAIERIAAGGDGVGRLEDGMTVFVPRAAPGDVLDVEVVERRRRYARARVQRVVVASPARVEPRCRHYVNDGCGGCQLQHLAPAAQLDAKRRIVGDAVRRIGKRDVRDPEIVPAPEPWAYRRKVTLAVDHGRIGLHRHDRPADVFDLVACPIVREPLMTLWRAIARHRALLPEGLRGLVLREDRDGRRHVVVEAQAGRPWDAGPLAAAVGDAGTSYWWRPSGGAPRVVSGPQVGFPVLVFEQVSPVAAGELRREAVAALDLRPGETAWDLYGGVGDTARLLAAAGAHVWSVDRDRAAVDWARERSDAAATRAPAGGAIHWVVGLVEESLHRLPEPALVVVNPPRAGLAAPVAARLEEWGRARPEARLAYVSCDPATLARDLARLGAFRLHRLNAYDLFPQTGHVETLAVLSAT